MVSAPAETHQAREAFRSHWARMEAFIVRQSDPETAEDRSMIPPHLANRF